MPNKLPRELKAIQKDVEAKKNLAFRDLTDHPAETKAGMMLAQNAAKEELLGLLKELDEAVSVQSLVISLSGTEQAVANAIKTLEDNAEENEKKVCILDADAVYKVIAADVRPSMGAGKGVYGATEVALCIGGLRRVASELGIFEFQRPDFARITSVWVDTDEKLVTEIKKVIRAAGGEELAALYIHRKAVDFATDTKFSGAYMYVFLRNASEDLVKALATKFKIGPATLAVDNESSKAAIAKALSQIRKSQSK